LRLARIFERERIIVRIDALAVRIAENQLFGEVARARQADRAASLGRAEPSP
jgi:hypothetical protein